MVDLIVIGSGPGGYVAAERAGEAGLSVILFEKKKLGGVCCNEGCIPTKSLLNSVKTYKKALEGEKFGVEVKSASFNMKKALDWKNSTVSRLNDGIAFLMKKAKVKVVEGEAVLKGSGVVECGGETYQAKNILIASGSEAAVPPIPGLADNSCVMTNREILQLDRVPASVAVIGGGVIGVEFASFFSAAGAKVSVIEMMDEILPQLDLSVAQAVRKDMADKVNFFTSAKVEKVEGGKVTYSCAGKEATVDAEIVLVAVGRRPESALFAESGLDIDKRGFIRVNEKLETNLPGVFAVGDVTGKSMLAHSASRMGEVVVNNLTGRADRMRYNAVPWAVYSLPEAAGCGITEQKAKEENMDVAVATVPMLANGRFLAEEGPEAPGFCKMIADKKSGVILGVHMVGHHCSEMIAVAAPFIEDEFRVQDVRDLIFPHPTVGEVIREAAWAIKVK